ncbi:MAG: 4Fe-4S dicluster domain-containing protein [Dictyoglomaceae bacterium]
MPKLVIKEDFCKSCGICIEICPKKVLAFGEHFNRQGYHPVILINEDECISCGICALVCPDVVFEVYRERGGR